MHGEEAKEEGKREINGFLFCHYIVGAIEGESE